MVQDWTGSVNLEVEIKLSAPLQFDLPSLEHVGELRYSPQKTKRTFTTYFDTSGYDLLSCGAALRFRSEKAERGTAMGIWTLKFAPPTKSFRSSRFEYEVHAAGEFVPDQFRLALQVFGATGSFNQLAVLSAERRSTILRTQAGEPVIEIDDDVVDVREGTNHGQVFREIEIELLDSGFGVEAEELAGRLVQSGAEYAKSSSKLEQAIENASNADFISGMLDRYERATAQDLSVLASIVLDLSLTGGIDLDELTVALGDGLGSNSARWFIGRMVAGLASEGSVHRAGEGNLSRVAVEVSLDLASELRSVGHADPGRLRFPSAEARKVCDLVLERAERSRGNGVAHSEFAAILGDVLRLVWGPVADGGTSLKDFLRKWS